MAKTEAQKQALKKYDEAHKDQFKQLHFKVNKEKYAKELEFYDNIDNKQGFFMYFLGLVMNESTMTIKDAYKEWQNTK